MTCYYGNLLLPWLVTCCSVCRDNTALQSKLLWYGWMGEQGSGHISDLTNIDGLSPLLIELYYKVCRGGNSLMFLIFMVEWSLWMSSFIFMVHFICKWLLIKWVYNQSSAQPWNVCWSRWLVFNNPRKDFKRNSNLQMFNFFPLFVFYRKWQSVMRFLFQSFLFNWIKQQQQT